MNSKWLYSKKSKQISTAVKRKQKRFCMANGNEVMSFGCKK